MKTLIGKDGYLFLQNDSSRELDIHCNNLNLTSPSKIFLYTTVKSLMLVVFPDKSVILQKYLPDRTYSTYGLRQETGPQSECDSFKPCFRPGLESYQKILGDKVIDVLDVLKDSPELYYYKTDTHVNFNGAYKVYLHILDQVNTRFGLNLVPIRLELSQKRCVLNVENFAYGDLLEPENLGALQISEEDKQDVYWTSPELEFWYYKKKVELNAGFTFYDYKMKDVTAELESQVLGWNLLRNHVMKFENKSKSDFVTLIFYDSFLCTSLQLWGLTLSTTYFIKNKFDPYFVEMIKPDYVLEFRIERFL